MKPILRFSQFTDDWEIEPLSEKTDIYDGTHQTPNYMESGIPFVSVENIKDLYATDKFISEEEFNRFKIKPQKGDILMTRITAGVIGDTAIVEDDSPMGYYVSLALIRNNNTAELDTSYLEKYINSEPFKRELYKRIIHIAFPKKINLGDIGECKIAYPSIEEQKQISQFLDLIDKRISRQEQIVEDWEAQKKGIIQKIFYQEVKFKKDDGTAYPEWEKIKLNQLLQERNISAEKDGTYEHISLTKEGVVPKSERYERDFLVTDDSKKYKITKYNDICYNPANLKFGVICRNKYKEGIFSPIYVTFETTEKSTPEFMEIVVTRADFINYALKYQEGTVYERMAVSVDDLLSISINLPCIEEQNKIVELVALYDKKIAAENTILEDLRNLKKGLLQKMFV